MCNYLQNMIDISFGLVMEFIGWWVLKNNILKGNFLNTTTVCQKMSFKVNFLCQE